MTTFGITVTVAVRYWRIARKAIHVAAVLAPVAIEIDKALDDGKITKQELKTILAKTRTAFDEIEQIKEKVDELTYPL
jgi:hypothetical protein